MEASIQEVWWQRIALELLYADDSGAVGWFVDPRFEEEAAEMEEWIGGKGIEGKC